MSSGIRRIVGWSIIVAAAGAVIWRGLPLAALSFALATIGLTVVSPTRGRLARYVLWTLFWAVEGVVFLWPGSIEMNFLVRAAFAAFCLDFMVDILRFGRPIVRGTSWIDAIWTDLLTLWAAF